MGKSVVHGGRASGLALVMALGLMTGCAATNPGRDAFDAAARACRADAATRFAPEKSLAGPATVVALDERPRRAYRIILPLAPDVDDVCPAGVRLRVRVSDPASGEWVTRTVPVAAVKLHAGNLEIVAGGPVARDSHIELAVGALRSDGAMSAAARLAVRGPLSPHQAALWFKAYQPLDPRLLPPAFFYHSRPNPRRGEQASLPVLRSPFANEDAFVAALDAHYQRFVQAGRLTAEQARDYLALVHDPQARRVFTGPDGVFRPLLMAAVLANAGTVGEPSIAALIGGDNVTGRPARVVFDPSIQGHLAETGVAGGRLIVRINPIQALPEPFALLAPIIGAHETFHQDNRVGREEEVIASYAACVAAAQQYLVNPALARADTRLARVLNARIVAMLNSGRGAFPWPGLLPAPLRQPVAEVLPGSIRAGTRPSLDAFLRHLYAATPERPTAGNAYADRVIAAITGEPVSGVVFDDTTIRLLDAGSRALSPADQFALMRMLRLQPAP